MENNGIITRLSKLTVKETIDKLEAILKQKNITIYLRINQQAEAVKAGIKLDAIEFLLFGNPQKGGQVMAEKPEAAIDLPLKVLAWEDSVHKTWVTYNEANFIQQRFSLSEESARLIALDQMITALLS
ncbi:uncharacterized protein (DUF302 family) [Pedobacter sp. UYP30]|uniref:DUF302 domain-containing protein n=1 Tax=Pedobacter sp. UYP30 TaxID=1756400 RepID=UPI00339208BD